MFDVKSTLIKLEKIFKKKIYIGKVRDTMADHELDV